MSDVHRMRIKLKRSVKTDQGELPKGSYLPDNFSPEAIARLLEAGRATLESAPATTRSRKGGTKK